MLLPDLSEYNINALVMLGNTVRDEFSRSRFRVAIVDKLLNYKYPMFYLLNKYNSCVGILREAYADLILINMKDNDYKINDDLADDIISCASLDSIMYYGADSKIYEFNKKCKEEFYRRGMEIEDKIELQRKIIFGKKLFKNLYKKKGDK